MFADEQLTQPIATLITAFESTGQTSFQCPTEPATVIILDPTTQKATFLERTAENQAAPAAGFWGWQGGILTIGQAAPAGHFVLCYSAGKILFYLDTYTLSGRRQFIVKSPFENDRTKIETIYLRVPAGYGTVSVSALSLEAAYSPTPGSSLQLSLDGNNWTDTLYFFNRSNTARVFKFYAKLSLPQSEQSGSFKVATIVLRTKGFRTSFSIPSNVVLVGTITSRSWNWDRSVTSFPNDDGTVTFYMPGGAFKVDPYNRSLTPAPMRFSGPVRHWQPDPITNWEIHQRLRQVGSSYIWDSLPYVLRSFYYFDHANNILFGRMENTDVIIKTDTAEVTPMSSNLVGLLPGYVITTTALLSYPALQQLNTVSISVAPSRWYAINDNVGHFVNGSLDYSDIYRVTLNRNNNTISTSSIAITNIGPRTDRMICGAADRSFFFQHTSSYTLALIDPTNLEVVRTIDVGVQHIDMNIDCSYLFVFYKGTLNIFRLDY